MSKGFQNVLAKLLQDYGGTKYRDYTLEDLKSQISDALNKANVNSPAERALISKFKHKILKAKTTEEILLMISEKMFSLDGNV